MSNREDQTAAALDFGPEAVRADDHRVAAEDLTSILKLIATQLQDVDRRQTEVLAQMQQRLEELGSQTRTTKARVPAAYVPAFERIQDGIHLLIERISENRAAETPASAPAATQAAEAAPQETVREELERIISHAAAAVAPAAQDDFAAEYAAGYADTRGDMVDTPSELGDEPWDNVSAEALARAYAESDDLDVGAAGTAMPEYAETGDAGVSGEDRGASVSPVALAAMLPSFSELPARSAAVDSPVVAPAPAPAYAPAVDFDRAWLQERFAEIAERVELSLADMRPDDSLFALNDRVERMQDEITSALKAVATREDLEGLRPDEAAFEEIAAHIERSTAKLDRIETIEEKLALVEAQLSDERFNALISEFTPAMPAAPAMPEIDFDRIATVAAEAVAERFAGLDRAPDATPVVHELREMLERFIADQRQEHEETTGSLDTIQQAMLNILDRVEALETSGLGPLAHASAEAHDDGDYEPETDFEGPTSLAAKARAQAESAAERASEHAPDAAPIAGHDPYAMAPQAPAPAPGRFEPASLDMHVDDDATAGVIAPDLPRMNAIERIRQDFIADAHRAKARAAAEAELNADKTQPLAGSRNVEAEPRASRSILSSIPGMGRVGSERSHSAKMDAVLSGSRGENVGGTIFGIRRNTLLIGAFVTLVAVTSALMLMRKDSPADGATPFEPAAIEQSIEGQSPLAGEEAPGDADAPGMQMNDSNPFDDPPSSGGDDADQSGPSQSWLGNGRPLASADGHLPGLDIQSGKRQLSGSELAQIESRRSTAELSSRLASSAAAASPASVMREFGVADAAQASNAAVTGAARSSQLNLPPATVGPLSLRLAAAKGDPSAQFEVAARLAEGKGTDQNFAEAVRWYERSAAQGFAQSMYRLGTLYERGLGVRKDLQQAAARYREAAEHGNIKAMHNLAVLSAGSSSGSPDYPTAAQWFEKAAAYGLSDSQYNLAVLYENGLGVTKSAVDAYKYYALSASSGDTEAVRRRDELGAALSDADRTRADSQIANWRLKTPDKIANDARAAGEDWKKRADGLYAS